MDVDLTEYSSSQPALTEQSSFSSEQQSLQKPAEVQPHSESADQSDDITDRVDLPEGLWLLVTQLQQCIATFEHVSLKYVTSVHTKPVFRLCRLHTVAFCYRYHTLWGRLGGWLVCVQGTMH